VESLNEFWGAIVIVLTMVAPVIGITGGVKGLFEWLMNGLPDINIGPIHVPDGLYLSWITAALLVAFGYYSGWFVDAPVFAEDPAAWFVFLWTTLGLAANIVRQTAGFGGSGGE